MYIMKDERQTGGLTNCCDIYSEYYWCASDTGITIPGYGGDI